MRGMVAVLPDARFRRPSERTGILVFLVAQAIVFFLMVKRSRKRARDDPLL